MNAKKDTFPTYLLSIFYEALTFNCVKHLSCRVNLSGLQGQQKLQPLKGRTMKRQTGKLNEEYRSSRKHQMGP